MSLVAYGASDDSETSDAEDTALVADKNKKETVDDQISDDEEYQAVSSTSSSKPISDYPLNNVIKSDESSIGNNVSSFSSYKDLPPPQKREEVTIEETELEEEVRQKPSEIADAPKPPPKTKQRVKITIPSLNEIPEDEDDNRSKKSDAVEKKPSGLFSLLPAPIHSAKKEINRPLIPHSLAKKPPTSKSNVQAKSVSSSSQSNTSNTSKSNVHVNSLKKHTTTTALIGYGSDDDDDDDEEESSTSQNFFSLGSSKETDLVSSSTDNKSVSNVIVTATEKENSENVGSEEETTSSQEEEVVVTPEPGLTNDSPLDFGNASRFSSWSSASSSYLGGLKPHHQIHAASAQFSSYPQSSIQYNLADIDVVPDSEESGSGEVPSEDLQQFMSDKEFQRLQGKRKRGVEEAISFVDAKVDDYVDPTELSKYITEETEYTSKKNKDDMPTSQQKRKKQITYLAFQAKEKELELKNTWSQNKLTKRQTQAKYGF